MQTSKIQVGREYFSWFTLSHAMSCVILPTASCCRRERSSEYGGQARIAQLVEHNLAKVGVASSSLVSRSIESLPVREAFSIGGKGLRGSETRKAWRLIHLTAFPNVLHQLPVLWFTANLVLLEFKEVQSSLVQPNPKLLFFVQ